MMIRKILEKLGIGDGSYNSDEKSRRKHIRHSGVVADVVVADQSFSLKDWSLGGLCFTPPPGTAIVAGDRISFQIRFRLPHETVQIVQTGKVVRALKRGFAAEFMPLSPEAKRNFARVLDGLHAQSFLASQTA